MTRRVQASRTERSAARSPAAARTSSPPAGALGSQLAHLQRTIGNRAVAELLRSPQRRDEPATIRRLYKVQQGAQNFPTTMKSRTFRKDKAVPNDEVFTAQQELPVGNSPSWFPQNVDPQLPTANIRHRSNANLVISDAADLAVEDTTDEPKVFFATKERIAEGNRILKQQDSDLRLETTSHYLRMTDQQNAVKKLQQVQPKSKSTGTRGTNVRVPQRCNEMADFVTNRQDAQGKASSKAWVTLCAVLDRMQIPVSPRPQNTLIPGQVQPTWQKELEATKEVAYRNQQAGTEVLRVLSELSHHFQQAMQNPQQQQAMEGVLQDLQLNGYMVPNIGDRIVTYAEATQAQEAQRNRNTTFLYHFAAVVAKSGSDYITMENYARRDDVVGVNTASGNDPLFFFRMYGPPGNGDSWHEKALATGAFLGATMSFVVE